MRRISSGSMVDHNKVMAKLVVIFTIGIFSIILAANHFNIDGIDLPDFEHYATVKQGGEFYGIEFNESTDIYGDSNVALLGNDEIEVTINPLLSNVKLSEVGELEEQEFEIHRFYGTVNAESDKISEEKAPAESELAIAYNLKIKDID